MPFHDPRHSAAAAVKLDRKRERTKFVRGNIFVAKVLFLVIRRSGVSRKLRQNGIETFFVRVLKFRKNVVCPPLTKDRRQFGQSVETLWRVEMLQPHLTPRDLVKRKHKSRKVKKSKKSL
jgi:hypothetical protein